MSERQREKIDQYVNCILCGLCYAACPVVSSNERFTGPAALARLCRFLGDPRERRKGQTLQQEDNHDGLWGCHTITRCIQVCPKQVRPTDGIETLRRRLLGGAVQAGVGLPGAEARPGREEAKAMKFRDSYLERRRFLGSMIGGGAAALAAGMAGPLACYVGDLREEPPPEFLELDAKDNELAPGASKLIAYGQHPGAHVPHARAGRPS